MLKVYIYIHTCTHTYERFMQSKNMQCLIMDFPVAVGCTASLPTWVEMRPGLGFSLRPRKSVGGTTKASVLFLIPFS